MKARKARRKRRARRKAPSLSVREDGRAGLDAVRKWVHLILSGDEGVVLISMCSSSLSSTSDLAFSLVFERHGS